MTDQTVQNDQTARPDRPQPYARPEPVVSPFNVPVVEEFRANGGRVGGMFEGGDLLLLTTTGARSGREYTNPLAYLRIDDRLLVVASAGGSSRDPDWYRNLLAHPMVVVELGSERFEAVAVPTEDTERDHLFEEIVRREPGFGDYESRSGRRLPVVELQPAAPESAGEVTNLAEKLFEVHGWLRGQLDRVRDEAEAYLAEHAGTGDPVGLNLQIRQHCLAFCESLHFHHSGEDGVFSNLVQGYPHLREPVERLIAEHRVVDRIRGELERLLDDLATADPDRFRAELDRMSRELNAHLDFEEESLIPVLSQIPFPPPIPAE